MAITYNNLYLDLRQTLIRKGIAGAALEAREIICYVSGKTRDEFFRDLQIYAPKGIQEEAELLLKRRLDGEPVAYLVGEWEFYGISLNLNSRVLIPRSDTEVLVDVAIEAAHELEGSLRLMDLCTGSGCVGIAIASKLPGVRAVLSDISPEVLKVAKQNVRRNDLTARVSCVIADALTAPHPSSGEFDIITCNPPYISDAEMALLDISVRGYEPRLALYGGPDGLDFYKAVGKNWKDTLKNGGRLLFECGINQIEKVYMIMRGEGFKDIRKFDDTQGIGRVIMGTYYRQ